MPRLGRLLNEGYSTYIRYGFYIKIQGIMNTLLHKLAICLTIGYTLANSCVLPKSNFSHVNMEKLLGRWVTYSVTPISVLDDFRCWNDEIYKYKGHYYADVSIYSVSTCSFVNMTTSIALKNGNIFDLQFLGSSNEWGSLYNVYDTDYTSYAISGGCPKAVEAMGGYIIWIWYRTWHPDQSTIDAAMAALKRNGLDCYEYGNTCPGIAID